MSKSKVNGDTSTTASEPTPITRTRRPRTPTDREDDFESVNVRFPKEVAVRIDRYIDELRIQAPWASPSRVDAVRALVMKGLPPATTPAPIPPPLSTPGYVGPGEPAT